MSFIVYICGVHVTMDQMFNNIMSLFDHYDIPWEGHFMIVNGYGYNVGYPVYSVSLLCLHTEAEKTAWNSASNHGISNISFL
jgi:hypothetical protein